MLPEGKTTPTAVLMPSETCECCILILRLFLKCKHTTGSGSGGAGHNCNSKDTEKSQQLAINLKAVLGELEERKEDFEKLKQKLDRLEVSSKQATVKCPSLLLHSTLFLFYRQRKRSSLTCPWLWRVNVTELSVLKVKLTT